LRNGRPRIVLAIITLMVQVVAEALISSRAAAAKSVILGLVSLSQALSGWP
jgi:hypothetical protein